MAENKNSEGLKFLFRLDQAAADKKALVTLARDTIHESHNKLTFLGRKDLRVKSISLRINAAFATRKAMMNSADFSSNDRLYMIMQKYVELAMQSHPKIPQEKALQNFCDEFASTYPQEYGVKSEQKSTDLQKSADKPNIALLMMKSAQNHNTM